MKGKLTKGLIFKTIGILLGSVTVFVGAVVGVMAIKGDFKKPVVHPTELNFVVDNNVVIFNKNGKEDEKWHSFVLHGKSDSEYDVNQKVCYIRFEEGEHLIKLYTSKNEEDQILPKRGYYKINCNENIYYTLVDPAQEEFDKESFGKIVITAKTENNMVNTDQPLTLWIDRQVNSVDLANTLVVDNDGLKSIDVAVDSKLYFDYIVEPYGCLKPNSNPQLGEKNVELYYKKDVQSDYQLVDANNYNNFGFIGLDDNGLYFESQDVGTYNFYMAVFPTYQDKYEYENSVIGISQTYAERLSNMMVTSLKVNTYSTTVDGVQFGADTMALSFRTSNKVVLNDDQDVEKLNLGITMQDSEGNPSTLMLNKFKFVSAYNDYAWINTAVTFASTTDRLNIDTAKIKYENNEYIYNLNEDGYIYQFVLTDYNVDGKTLVNSLKKIKQDGDSQTTEMTYYCEQGYAFIESTQKEGVDQISIYHLAEGAYLGFFTKDDHGMYKQYFANNTDFPFEVTHIAGTSQDKKAWDVVIKEKSTQDNLYMIALIVNSHAGKGAVYDVAGVKVEEVDFGYELLNQNLILKSYVLGEGEEASQIFSDIYGSYTNYLLITPKDKNDKYEVDVLTYLDEEAKEQYFTVTIEDKEYVIVGYIKDNSFVNKVRAKQEIDGYYTTLYVLNIKELGYGATTESYISGLIASKDYQIDKPVKLFTTNKLNVEVQLVVDASQIDITYDVTDEENQKLLINNGSSVTLYENQIGEYSIKLVAKDGYQDFVKLVESSNIAQVSFAVYNKANNKILDETEALQASSLSFNTHVKEDKVEAEIELILDTNDALTDGQYIIATFKFNDVKVNSCPIYINSTNPNEIYFNYLDNNSNQNQITLPESYSNYDNVVIKAVVGFEDDKLTYTYYIKDGHSTSNGLSEVDLNGYITTDSIVAQALEFTSTNTDVCTIQAGKITANRVGTAYIEIKASSKTVYLMVKVEKTEDVDFSIGQTDISSSGSSLILDGIYIVGSNDISNKLEILSEADIKVNEFGIVADPENECKISGNNEDGYVITISDTDIAFCEISRGTDDIWTITRTNYQTTNLELQINLQVPTEEAKTSITMRFNPPYSINFNTNWSNNKVYENTAICLAEEKTETDQFTTNAYFQIINSTGKTFTASISKVIQEGTEVTSELDDLNKYGSINDNLEFKPLQAGRFTIIFECGEGISVERTIDVVPNIVAVFAGESVFNSESTIGLALLKKLENKKYGDGSSNDPIYNFNDDLEDLTNAEGLKVQYSDYITFEDNTFNTGIIEELGASVEETIHLTINGARVPMYQLNDGIYTKIESRNVTISNKYKFTEQPDMVTIMAKTNYTINGLKIGDYKFTLNDGSGEITSISVKYADKTEQTYNKSGDLKLDEPLTEPYDAQLIIEVEIDSKTYSYTYKNAKVVPYQPEASDNLKFWSGSEIDLITDIFEIDVTQINNNGIFAELVVEGVSNEDLFTSFERTGYRDNSLYSATAQISNTVIGISQTVEVIYTLKYTDGLSYQFSVPITIKNQYGVVANYPFNDLKGSDNLSDITLTGERSYEPVLIGQTISLVGDETFGDRISIKNVDTGELLPSSDVKNYIADIQIYAYKRSFTTYVNNGSIVCDKANLTIKFNNSSYLGQGAFGQIIFKIITTSGAYEYYTVYLYNPTTDYKVNQKCISQDLTSSDEMAFVSENKIFGQDVNFAKFNLSNVSISNINYYLLGVSGIGAETEYSFDEQELTLMQQFANQNLSDKTLPKIDQFTTITIGLVYKDSSNIFYIGCIKFNIMPASASNGLKTAVNSLADGYKYDESNANIGEYTKYIAPNEWTVDCPFDDCTKADIVKSNIAYSSILSLDNGIITILQYISKQNLEFDVEYTANGVKYLVHYIYECIPASDVSTSTYKATLCTTTDFENAIDLSSIFGNYKGKVTLTFEDDSTKEINLADIENVDELYTNISISSGKLVFKPINCQYTATIKAHYDSVNDNDLTKNIVVTVNRGMIYTLENQGSIQEKAMPTTIVEGRFDTAYPNTLTITKDGNHYNVGGLDIYTSESAELELSFSNSSYVDGLSDGKLTVNATQKINFVHTSEDSILQMYIKVKDASDNYYAPAGATSGQDQITFYIKVLKTYNNVVACYQTIGSNHDVVTAKKNFDVKTLVTEQNCIEGIENSYRLQISYSVGETNVTNAVNFEIIGFLDINNPNCLTFAIGENGGVALTSGTNSSKYAESLQLKFDNVTEQKQTEIIITNLAGANLRYKYNILPNGNGLTDFNANNTTDGESYAVIAMNDYDSSLEQDTVIVDSKDVAQIIDEENNTFFIKDATLVTKDDVNYYQLTNAGYNLLLSVSSENMLQATLIATEGRTIVTEPLTFTFTIYGNNLVKEDFTLVFFNNTIQGKQDGIYYSATGDYIHLDEDDRISITDNATGQKLTSLSDYKFEILKDKSYYVLDGRTIYVKDPNPVFKYNKDNKYLQLYAVPSSTYISITFNVIYDGYIVGEVEYSFTSTRSVAFYINGNASTNYVEYKNYALTTSSLDENKANHTDDFNSYDLNTISVNNTKYYVNLGIELKNSYGDNASRGLNNVSFAVPEKYSDVFKIEDQKLIFLKDYTGTIEFTMSYGTGANGVYSVVLELDVLGLITKEYVSQDLKQNNILNNNGSNFTSGTKVNLFGQIRELDTGIIASNTNGKNNNTISADDVKITTEYYAQVLTNDLLLTFDPTKITGYTPAFNVDATKLVTDNTIEAILPSVEQGNVNYLVTYKITIKYFGTHVYYVSYVVYDTQKLTLVSAAKSGINVDNSPLLFDGTKLNVLTYYETFETSGGDKATLAYDKSQYVLTIGSNKYNSYTYIGNYGEYVVSYKAEDSKYHITNSDNYEDYVFKSTTKSKNSMFEADYSGLQQFATFVKNISEIKIGETTYTLCFDNGNYYIDLREQGVVFTNQLIADFAIQTNINKPAITIPAYNNGSGFRLYANTTLTSKAEELYKVSDIFLEDQCKLHEDNNETKAEFRNHVILGVIEDINNVLTSWVNNASSVEGYRQIGTVNGLALYKVEFKGNSNNNLYELKDYFYVVSGTGQINVVDYQKGEGWYFSCTTGELDLSKLGASYIMDDDVFIKTADQEIVITNAQGLTYDSINKKLTSDTSGEITVTGTVNGTDVEFTVIFE